MRFRLKAFTLHLVMSALVLSCTLGGLYLGWYHWPGWYLAAVIPVVTVMVGVDVVLGPLLTFVIASERKPRRELARDIGIIVAVQLVAFGYGATTLWHGRPLYYAFSVNCLSIVQGYDLDPEDTARAQRENRPLAPHWNSLPRWIYAPLPGSSAESEKIVSSALSGGYDVTARPTYFRSWQDGRNDLRGALQRIDDIKFFSGPERQRLKERVRAAGLDPSRPTALAFTGRARPLLAVFDPQRLELRMLVRAD